MRGRPGQRSRPRKKRGTYQPGVGETPGTPREHGATRPAGATEDRSVDRRAHPATGPDGHVPGRGPTRPQVSTHTHGPTGPRQETSRSRPISRHRALLRRESAPTPPPLLGFPCSDGLRGPPIRGRLAAPCPLPCRVSCFPLTQAGFVAWPPGIRGGLNGIRGGLSAVRGSAHVCRSNPPGSRRPPAAPSATRTAACHPVLLASLTVCV